MLWSYFWWGIMCLATEYFFNGGSKTNGKCMDIQQQNSFSTWMRNKWVYNSLWNIPKTRVWPLSWKIPVFCKIKHLNKTEMKYITPFSILYLMMFAVCTQLNTNTCGTFLTGNKKCEKKFHQTSVSLGTRLY